MSFAFDPGRSVAQNLSRLGASELRTALDTARDLSRPPAERIHEARTHCKRSRALLRIVGKNLRAEDRAVRNAAVLLSSARDGQVLRHTLADLELDPQHYPPEGVDTLWHTFSPEEDGQEAASLASFAAAIEPIYRRAGGWHLSELGWEDVAAGAGETYRRAHKAMHRAARTGKAADFHDWRKQVKYNWHHLSLLRRFAPDHFRTARDTAKALASRLGKHHDREVLHQQFRHLDKPRPLPGLGKLLRHRNKTAAEEALELGAELYAASPDDWREYISAVIECGDAEDRPVQQVRHAAGD